MYTRCNLWSVEERVREIDLYQDIGRVRQQHQTLCVLRVDNRLRIRSVFLEIF